MTNARLKGVMGRPMGIVLGRKVTGSIMATGTVGLVQMCGVPVIVMITIIGG